MIEVILWDHIEHNIDIGKPEIRVHNYYFLAQSGKGECHVHRKVCFANAAFSGCHRYNPCLPALSASGARRGHPARHRVAPRRAIGLFVHFA
jgi:uncharacterized ParB-like nuclease family protein